MTEIDTHSCLHMRTWTEEQQHKFCGRRLQMPWKRVGFIGCIAFYEIQSKYYERKVKMLDKFLDTNFWWAMRQPKHGKWAWNGWMSDIRTKFQIKINRKNRTMRTKREGNLAFFICSFYSTELLESKSTYTFQTNASRKIYSNFYVWCWKSGESSKQPNFTANWLKRHDS